MDRRYIFGLKGIIFVTDIDWLFVRTSLWLNQNWCLYYYKENNHFKCADMHPDILIYISFRPFNITVAYSIYFPAREYPLFVHKYMFVFEKLRGISVWNWRLLIHQLEMDSKSSNRYHQPINLILYMAVDVFIPI